MSRRKDTLRQAAAGEIGALRWSVLQRTGDALASHILISMACAANSSWICYMALTTIAKQVECSVKTVERKIPYLLQRGYLEEVSDQFPERRTKAYRLCPTAASGCG